MQIELTVLFPAERFPIAFPINGKRRPGDRSGSQTQDNDAEQHINRGTSAHIKPELKWRHAKPTNQVDGRAENSDQHLCQRERRLSCDGATAGKSFPAAAGHEPRPLPGIEEPQELLEKVEDFVEPTTNAAQ